MTSCHCLGLIGPHSKRALLPIGTVSADSPVYPASRRSYDAGVGAGSGFVAVGEPAKLSIKDCLVDTTVVLGQSILLLEEESPIG